MPYIITGVTSDCISTVNRQFLTKSSEIPYYCSPPSLFDMFEGEGLISILKIWV